MSSQPSTKVVGKTADGRTSAPQTEGSKQIKCMHLPTIGTAAEVGPAPTSRVYTKDYGKIRERDDKDGVSIYLGNPLRW